MKVIPHKKLGITNPNFIWLKKTFLEELVEIRRGEEAEKRNPILRLIGTAERFLRRKLTREEMSYFDRK